MDGDSLRREFLEFFEGKGHVVMPSSSLVPAGDPTLLFTSAGMVQFKPFFMGESTPPSRRLASCQKSFRTNDIDEVGDHKHLTFFEMLGNFSIGDYFKKEAIEYAWEFVTQRFKLLPERLYVTIFLDDEESYRIWHEEIGVPEERIYRYDEKDNWWGPAGKEGPCGPCTEIHYDGGIERGCGTADCHPNHECERFVELWNLVLMQFYQDPEGKRTPLPAPSVDTGMGLERAATILQGKNTIYETDLFWPIIERVEKLSGKKYGADRETDYALRVVAEHARAAAFLIADGVVPGNAGRGYVLRRVIRRAIRYGRRLGLQEVFLSQVAEAAIERFKDAYPELGNQREFVLRVVGLEEERFGETFERGYAIIKGMVVSRSIHAPDIPEVLSILRSNPENRLDAIKPTIRIDDFAEDENEGIGRDIAFNTLAKLIVESEQNRLTAVEAWPMCISGTEAFVLYDTYGFPPELTAEIAREHGLTVDMEGFEREMGEQRKRARAAQAFEGAMEMLPTYEGLGAGTVEFVGYESTAQESVVAALLVDPSAGSEQAPAPVGHATKGQQVEVILKETPFYAEGGGQVGDAGTITGPNGRVRVEDTQAPIAGLIVHRGVVEEGDISLGDPVRAEVDALRRADTAGNHTGTHLLHAALRQVLGSHVRQAGSLVTPDRLRFDFSHIVGLSPEELGNVQSLVNQKVRDNLTVTVKESTYAQAVQEGALAFFGDKYGEVVRVVEMGDTESFSKEVCGGTHLKATGQVGAIFVLGESSIGGGMRRIESVTGRAAEGLFVERTSLLDSLARRLQTPLSDLEPRLESFMGEVDQLRKRLATLERETLRQEAQELLGQVQDVNGVKVVTGCTSATNVDALREMGDWLKSKLVNGVVALGMVQDSRPTLIAMVTSDLTKKGLHAGNIVREVAQVMEGGGGGQPEMAQAGGKRAYKLEEALRQVAEVVRREARSGKDA